MEPKPELFLAIVMAILFVCLVLNFLYKRGKKSKVIIFPKDLKESSSQYAERKEDDHRKFNNRKGY